MEGLATASANQLPAESPARPLLRVVTGNLQKEPENEKFRRIKLSGKAGQKITAEPAAMTVLTMMGFRKQTGEDGEDYFVVDKLMPSCVSAVAAALAPAAPAAPRPAPAALNADGTPKASSCCAPQEEKLSTTVSYVASSGAYEPMIYAPSQVDEAAGAAPCRGAGG